jgi:hypothetical protein
MMITASKKLARALIFAIPISRFEITECSLEVGFKDIDPIDDDDYVSR